MSWRRLCTRYLVIGINNNMCYIYLVSTNVLGPPLFSKILWRHPKAWVGGIERFVIGR